MTEKEGQGKQGAKAPRDGGSDDTVRGGRHRETGTEDRARGDGMMGEKKEEDKEGWGGAEVSKLERNWQ